jgi:serine/threonine-protein kinase CLA4
MVALKIVPAAGNAVKLSSLKRELELVRGVRHPNILGFDGVFVDTDAEALWLAMELMERSLADVLSLSSPDMGLDPTERGKVILSERLRARCVWDALLALSYLKKQRIAHRDLRSDNLLVSPEGVIKLADFGCAVRAPPGAPRSSERVGVVYWQAPEMRTYVSFLDYVLYD